MSYRKTITTDRTFDDTIDALTDALSDEGFGILSDIDVQDAFRKKLDLDDYPRYRILGACNPPIAKAVLDEDMDAGVLLPCNVVVYETDDGVTVTALAPEVLVDVADDADIGEEMHDASERLDRALSAL
jgi:uncharacterized protein (DUF302 family)